MGSLVTLTSQKCHPHRHRIHVSRSGASSGSTLAVLAELRITLEPQEGILVVEVPHANDLLISQQQCKLFIEFTLWSRHLVLHTRDSLQKLLGAAGFQDIQIKGVQRYGLANHLTWLSDGRPGGHKGRLSLLESQGLTQAYEAALDCTDTLVAMAKVGSNRCAKKLRPARHQE